ncbi:hypothetical protein [Arthrobacter sp. SLBN-122]|uniref:hypothetical protein n=1 Tax=Arthrobacter sp. SLBN-122 TaxID=2768455 RepID=UPI0011505D63|nr:hypothetical protein [Arthrobacter sp. SLBN-122]
MESASLMALLFVGAVGGGRSAEPNAPQIIARPSRMSAAWTAARSRTATFLHRLAWAVEPDPR